jgi:hypothetical protein
MGDPGRLDSEIIKVSVNKEKYRIPANCFFSPIEKNKKNGGYFIQPGVLLRVSWPELQCKTKRNSDKFSGFNFSQRMQVHIYSFNYVNYDKSFKDALFIATHPHDFVGREPVIENPMRRIGGEIVYSIRRDPRLVMQADYVYTNGKDYIAYCVRAHKNNEPSDWRGCTITLFRKTNAIGIDFDPRNFDSRSEIISKVTQLITEISA